MYIYTYIVFFCYHELLLMLTVKHLMSCFWNLKQSNNQLTIHVDRSEVNKLRCELIQYQKPCTNQVSMHLHNLQLITAWMLIFFHHIFRLLLRQRITLWPQASVRCKMWDIYSFLVYNS